jgi:carboxyl-terminal processing protease
MVRSGVMSRPWRYLAILVFTASVLFGGLFGDHLLALSGDTETQIRRFTEVLQVAHAHYGAEVKYKDLVYSSIDGMLRTLDPHTNFLSPEDYEDMRERQQGSFFGLGILVSMRDGELTVISPIEGTPAWRLGLRAGDVISAIEGEPTDKMSIDDAVNKLKGPKGTQVNVTINRRGKAEPMQLAITRAEIPQNTVRYAYMMTPDVGYVRLTDFSRSTSREMHDAIERLKKEGMKKLLLDLRSNGGGLLDQTVTVSGFFVPEGTTIVSTRGRVADSKQVFEAEGDHPPLDIPLIVLVNNGTASAAEILSGAIQDHDVGLVVGTPTWGKGLVQTVYNLSYGSGLALTTAKYYTPSGRLIQRDYSSFYDYYSYYGADSGPGTAGEVQDTVPEVKDSGETFATDLGREVHGGGGITPDVLVELPEGPQILTALFSRNAFFEFAVDYNNRNPVKSTDFKPEESVITEFRDWVLAEKITTAEPLDEMLKNQDARDFTLRQIRSDIFTAAFGLVEAHRVISEGDAQIQKALGLFPEAAALLEKRLKVKVGDPPKLASKAEAGNKDS